MKKKNLFYLIIISFLFFLIYSLAGVYGYIEYKKFKPYLFRNSVDMDFHYKYSNKVKSASKKDIVAMANLCIKNLEEVNFFKSKEKNR